MTGSLSRAFHFGLPRRTAIDVSRSPVEPHLVARPAGLGIRQSRETKWT